MTRTRPGSELGTLTQLAEELARSRRESANSAHLLAAIASQPSAAADLLVERRLGAESVLAAASGKREELPDPIESATARARELATNMGLAEATAAHLLGALLNDRRCLAHRAASELGADLPRLRAATLHVALGVIGRRRVVGSPPASRAAPSPARTVAVEPRPAPRRPSGIALPVIPPEAAGTLPRAPRSPQREAAAPSSPATAPDGAAAAPNATVAAAPSATAAAAPSAPAATAPSATAATAAAAAPAARSPVTPPATESIGAARRARAPRRAAPADVEARFAVDARRFPLLAACGRNLTLLAARGELDPVIGREPEIERALDVLAKRRGNSPVFVGRPGVGKAAAVRGLAQQLVRTAAAGSPDDRVVVEIPVVELFAGTGVRGALADRFATLRKEVTAHGRVVLYFDDLAQLLAGDGAEEILGELRTTLTQGALPCVGTVTPEQAARLFGADPALARCFTAIELEEPDRADAFLIAESACERLGAHHGVAFTEAALARTVSWSIRYLPGQALPEKVLSIADLAGARARRRGQPTVDVELMAELVAELADVPVERLLDADGARMLELEQLLAERVVGHEAELHRIARILRRNAAGLVGRRPLGTFLLLGPTGVGKTETAKAVAEVLFHSDAAMTRIDLSEYGEAHAVARLIGAPPGYVGHEAGGQLTEAVRRRPYQVLLLDEIEKAHPDVLLAFLGVLDEGRLTDGRGRTVDFTNTVIFLTSNLGADESGARVRRRVGFGGDAGPSTEDRERGVVAAARQALAPELYNRIDEVLVFSPLDREVVREIARRALARLDRTLAIERKVHLACDPDAIDALLDAGGYDPTLGARPLRRTIARLVEAPLADRILRGELAEGDVAWLTLVEGELTLEVIEGPVGDRAASNAAE